MAASVNAMTLTDLAVPRPALDPRVSLATALASQPGVYALLLGSGISTSAGIPTGWGIVESLVRRVAAASGNPVEGERWEQWWEENAGGLELGYSQLLAELASTPPARRALLAGFFEPAEDDDHEAGTKIPGAAHKAIAQLVAKGVIRVVVTTNFDRLLEHALAALNIMPQVISTDTDVAGMEPLQHARVTIIKVNGDYASLDQRNTAEELSSYPEATTQLLRRVFDEYGLIVSGWSGDWDAALVTAVKGSASRRYPLYWTARSATVSGAAAEVTARGGSHIIHSVAAEQFFPDILSRVEAVQGLLEAPVSRDVKLARLRRSLADPVRHLEVRALLEDELTALREWARQRSQEPAENTNEAVLAEIDAIQSRFATLIELFATGILLDRDRQHDDLWVWGLQQALCARVDRTGTYLDWWVALAHYPAFLMFRAGIVAALQARHESVIVRIAQEPTWSSFMIREGRELPAFAVLHLYITLNNEVIRQIAPTTRSRFPVSYFVRERLRPLAELIGGGVAAGTLLLDRMEYRLALASHRLESRQGTFPPSAAGGEYLRNDPWFRSDSNHLAVTDDFLRHGDRGAWGYRPSEHTEFESFIERLDERLGSLAERN